jgi:hypothetical protein
MTLTVLVGFGKPPSLSELSFFPICLTSPRVFRLWSVFQGAVELVALLGHVVVFWVPWALCHE